MTTSRLMFFVFACLSPCKTLSTPVLVRGIAVMKRKSMDDSTTGGKFSVDYSSLNSIVGVFTLVCPKLWLCSCRERGALQRSEVLIRYCLARHPVSPACMYSYSEQVQRKLTIYRIGCNDCGSSVTSRAWLKLHGLFQGNLESLQ